MKILFKKFRNCFFISVIPKLCTYESCIYYDIWGDSLFPYSKHFYIN